MKNAIPLLLVLCLIIFAGSFACTSDTKPEDPVVPEEIDKPEDIPEQPSYTFLLIDKKVFTNRRKGGVKFTHDQHKDVYKISCKECHHKYENDENIWKDTDSVQGCEACHHPVEKQGNVDKLQMAYHKNCKDCHKKLAEEGKNAPFKKCNGCHEQKT
ncbi:MAG: cytochrome c3 family protein [Nanoarchaeota archaeon]|nr:cytochrome c3 family protein [Nanoarchaeota archaeon]